MPIETKKQSPRGFRAIAKHYFIIDDLTKQKLGNYFGFKSFLRCNYF